jgi:hypothetical protein
MEEELVLWSKIDLEEKVVSIGIKEVSYRFVITANSKLNKDELKKIREVFRSSCNNFEERIEKSGYFISDPERIMQIDNSTIS